MTTPAVAPVIDPWDSVENPAQQTYHTWGLCEISTYFCVLEKGMGKVPFDATKHSADQRRTAVEILVTPLAEMNASKASNRSLIAESKEWAAIVLPSIRDLGISPRELNGKYVRIGYKPTGRTYVNNNGETKDQTTIVFEAVFADENACRADYLATNGTAAPAAPAPAGNDKERTTALAFLKVIVKNACAGQTDLTVIRNTIAANLATMPAVGKFFSVDSPETTELIASILGA